VGGLGERAGPPESAGGASGRIRPRPADDVTAPGDDLAVIQDEDRDGPLTAEFLDLCAVSRVRGPGPRPQASALNPLDLVCVAGVVERLRCPSARMGERRRGAAGELLQGARVENHRGGAYSVV